MHRPERWGSHDQEDFNEAYRNRPILLAVVNGLYGAIFLCGIGGLTVMIFVSFLKGLGLIFLAVVCFVCWAILNNWAVTHPK